MDKLKWSTDRLAKQSDKNGSFERHIIDDILNKKENIEVLDVGCSNGYNTEKRFKDHKNIKSVIGIDVNAAAVCEAKKNLKDNRFRYLNRSIFEFDVKKKFDIIYMSYVLNHLSNQSGVLKKIYDMLKEDGVIIIKTTDDDSKLSFPDKENVTKKIMNLYDERIRMHNQVTCNTDRYHAKKCYSLLKDIGFKNINYHYEITDTVNKTKEERIEIYESYFHFRDRYDSDLITKKTRAEMNELLKKQKLMFLKDDYYFSSITYMIIGFKS